LFQINGKRGFAPKSFLNEYKVLKRDLLYEVPVYKFNGEVKVQPEKFESIEKENSESHTLLKDELSQDDNKTPSLKYIDEGIIKESHTINADSVSPSYEMIDGTTVYFESNPSVQPSSVSEVTHTTALPNEQASMTPDSEIEELSSDKNTFINNKELEPGTNDASSKLEGIKLDIQKETNLDFSIENSEAIIESTLDTVNKDGISVLDGSSKSEKESFKKIEHMEKLDDSAKENVEDNKKEKVTEHVESDSIFASITKTFNILSNLETVTTDSTIIQSSDDTTSETTENNLQLQEQVSENIEVDAVTENILQSQIKLESNIDQSFTDKEKVEAPQEVIHESTTENITESIKVSNEKIDEASTIIVENITSNDVPLPDNVVHENVDKPAKELPTTSSILANNNSVSKLDVDSHVEKSKTNDAKEVTENIRTDDAIISGEKESTILSNLQETLTTNIITQSSDDIEQKLLESNEAYLENIKKDVDNEEIIGQADKNVIAEISETISLSSETAEDITTKSFSESYSVDENLAITEEALNRSTEDIQFNKESIVHNNVNKNDNLVNDISSDNVPMESNEISKSSDLGPKKSTDSSQESISEQTMILNKILKKQDLPSIENLEHKDSKLLL